MFEDCVFAEVWSSVVVPEATRKPEGKHDRDEKKWVTYSLK